MVESSSQPVGFLESRRTESGHSAPSTKYKHGRAYAIRDFPPGCGWLAARGEQAVMRKVVFVSENSVKEISGLQKDLPQGNVANSKKEIFPKGGVKSYPDQSSLRKTLGRKHYSQGGATVVRDFPPFCGDNVPPLSKEGRMKWLASLKNKNVNSLMLVKKEKPLEKTICTDVKQVIEAVQDETTPEGCAPMLSTEDIRYKPEKPASGKTKKQGAYEASSRNDKTEGMNNMFENSSKSPFGSSPNEFDSKSKETEDKDFQTKLSDSSAFENQALEKDRERQEVLSDRWIVPGLMTSTRLPGKVSLNPALSGGSSKRKRKKSFMLLQRAKIKKNSSTKRAHQGLNQVVIWAEKDSFHRDGQYTNDNFARRSCNNNMSFPSCQISTVHHNDEMTSRSKVREALRLFQAICRMILQEEESKLKGKGKSHRRVDYLAVKIFKQKMNYVNTGESIIGTVPGVEVGDEFQYFVELNIVGLHRPSQAGIDYVKQGERIVATSIIASGSYEDDLDNSDVLWYMGQGGNVMQKGKQPEDQKLERGNLALANSKVVKNPVRVIRGETRSSGLLEGRCKAYVYDGLYLVEEFKQEPGPHGKLVYKFKLVRIPGQPEIAWRVVRKSKVREGLCVHDISNGKEIIPICAINTIDAEKPPTFLYVPRMMYPDWFHCIPSKGCNCINGCSQSAKCSCVMKNGGDIPYNHNGAIVVPKPLVYECGPSCKCPASCYNRVSQHGIRFQFEIFKTKSKGWGVRSLNSIPSGSFICEYTGELIEDREAEKRIGHDEYLFDIGNNYSDSSLWNDLSTLMHDGHSSFQQVVQDSGFTIDAVRYGNMGRFLNHSCSPNLYAQNVLYDHDDKRIPHIMLFAAENIPPLQELTYHYNYMVDQVHDENGDIKKRSCYCGSSKCTGRLY
ncbi:histone-lysine N-methyltransferase, H3 lysine-9 specific SUVH6-like [Hibiscus syriacus]|uniref:histone-lysine N-methyltransferase, H3 lysine-9 specific SUVH6-like n=1 Tax=Hibiscus syriacus TaxID=106335 RepID=UPI001923E438|nr:histone-lysine N-methyltransferase, H3 lysine-9 specific SUVH6-like [Hibiscus syriacus]